MASMMTRTFFTIAAASCLATGVAACSANSNDNNVFGAGGTGGSFINPGTGGGGDGGGSNGSGGTLLGNNEGGVADDCSDNAKKIFVVSKEGALYTFDPGIPGLGAYVKLGNLNCPATTTPQTMGVDRSGTAWVFYSGGHLFRVTTDQGNVVCSSTTYQHPGATPGGMYTLGMGFTATAPSSKEQSLYMISDTFGLATIDVYGGFAVTMTNALKGTSGELTGGPDGRLFTYEATSGQLSEIALGGGYAKQPITTLSNIAGASGWAFSRYGGVFYIFTSAGLASSQCSTYDPASNAFGVRDTSVGFTVVGAGQSTCVPPPVPK